MQSAESKQDKSEETQSFESEQDKSEETQSVEPVQDRDEKTVQVNDVVRITQDAAYYNGKQVKDWVKKNEWIVKSVEGDRVVVGRNIKGTNEINSPFNIKDLTVVSHREPEPEPEPKPDKPTRMDISEEGVKFIMKFEGCRLQAYQCAGGTWTIGYGHTRGVTPNDTLPSEEAARALLYEDLNEYTGYVNTYREQGVISFPLNQNQFDALTSFCYNRGSERLRELVTDRSEVAVADGMLAYILVNGEVNEGLRRRREEERAMFLS